MSLFMAMALIVEIATIELADGKTEAGLIAASKVFQDDFLNHQPGFIKRELVRSSEGKYLDIVHWRSQEDIDALMQNIDSSKEVQSYFSIMKFDSENPTNGVEHYSSIGVYESQQSQYEVSK